MSDIAYGALTPVDISVLESVLSCFKGSDQVTVLEIGIYEGKTAQGIKAYMDRLGVKLDYWGIDSGAICSPKPPFDGAHLIIGDSAECAHLVPECLDLVLMDGCHCLNHVMLELIHYAPKVVLNGFILLHDISPEIQHKMKDPHGEGIPEFQSAVNKAIGMVGFPFLGWELWRKDWLPGCAYGGMAAYRKTYGTKN